MRLHPFLPLVRSSEDRGLTPPRSSWDYEHPSLGEVSLLAVERDPILPFMVKHHCFPSGQGGMATTTTMVMKGYRARDVSRVAQYIPVAKLAILKSGSRLVPLHWGQIGAS